jgi:hypothetical protein
MTERHGYGDEQPSGERPSGRGAVAERRARQDEQEAHEVELTDEAAASSEAAAGEPDQEASGAFEAEASTVPPGATASAASTSIFDVGRQEHPAGATAPAEPTELDADADRADAEREAAATEAAEAAEAADREAAAADAERDVAAAEAVPAAPAGPPAALLGGLDTEGIRSRFLDIQAGFVDEPRQAVEEAGRFTEELVQQVIDALQAQRGQLHAPVDEGSTEDLRLALRSYRQFVDRLLGLAM